MKKLIATMISSTLLASGAIAGNYETPTSVDVMPAAASVADWSGFYAGGLVSFDSGTLDYANPPGSAPYVEYDLNANTSYGAFAGYNMQRDALVYGAEVAYNSGGAYPSTYDDEAMPYVLDVKGRVGFAAGKALIYGVAAYSMSEWTTSETYNLSGFSYGLGLDYLIGDHMFVGAEYLIRDMSGARSDDPDQIGHTDLSSASLRVGWKF